MWKLLKRFSMKWLIGFLVVLIVVGVVGSRQLSYYLSRRSEADINRDRITEAQNSLKYALKLWRWNSDAYFFSARAARISHDLSGAEQFLERCKKIDGGATERTQLEYLLIRVQSGEIDDLSPLLFDLVERENGYPDTIAILKTFGRSYMTRLRYRPALACMSKWIELSPDDPLPYQYRGWSLERLSNPKSALQDYQKALELDPTLLDVRLRIVEMYLEDKQAPEALPHAEYLYQRSPENPRVQARMGMTQFLMGNSADARTLMLAAEPYLPEDPALLVAIANLELQDSHPEEAERRLRKVIAIDPSDTEALYVLSNALQIQGRTAESQAVQVECLAKRKIVDRIHELLKDSTDTPNAKPDAYAEIGELFLQIDREKFGLYWSNYALEINPTNQRAHRTLATYYEKKGDLETSSLHRRQLRSPSPSTVQNNGKP